MVLCELDNGNLVLYDCNVTNENENDVLSYLGNTVGWGKPINIFVNSHRDADHMRGVKKIHDYFPIKKVWDSGVTGNTPASTEYREYMDLRRTVGFREVEKLKRWNFGKSVLRVMNSCNDALADPNAQCIVIKVEHLNAESKVLVSAMLTGDSHAQTWCKSILSDYDKNDLSSTILLASHHGSISFFDDPEDREYYFTEHIKAISPKLTIISVGDNPHGHPDDKAIELYEKHSKGISDGSKIRRTDKHGNVKIHIRDNGTWTVQVNQ